MNNENTQSKPSPLPPKGEEGRDSVSIEIDSSSGFCFGVTTAIKKAEEELAKGTTLYCLGDIVHNAMECERLRHMGLVTISHEDMARLHNAKVLLRAHGEPPETYQLAQRNNIEIIDATCPVVLQLQRRIKRQYEAQKEQTAEGSSIIIFGKPGHAEVLGLVGQTQGHATVIANQEDAKHLDFSRDIYLYSQTTKSLDEFQRIITYIRQHIAPGRTFQSFDTICRQVANRMPNVSAFAQRHQLEAVKDVHQMFCTNMMSVAAASEESREAMMKNAITMDLRYMRSILNYKQYKHYLLLLNTTLVNRGLR